MGMNCSLNQVVTRVKNMKESMEPRIVLIETDVKKLEELVVDNADANLTLITKMCDNQSDRLKVELGKL